MATFTVIEHQRVDDYAVVQTLETTDIAIGQTITLSGLGHSLNGSHVVFAVPTHLFIGVDDYGDLLYDPNVILPNQLLFYDQGDHLERSAAIPNGTLTWTQTCTWITSADVQVFLGFTPTGGDVTFLSQCVAAANAWCFARRVQAGYHDSLTTVPSDAVKMGDVLMAASLYRERGSVDSFQSFDAMGTAAPVMTMGRVNQLLGIKRSQVA